MFVTGECEMPTPGYTLELKPAEPPGFNPKDLILILTAQPPTDVQPQVLTWTPVRWEEDTDVEYDTVSIRDVVSGIRVEHVE